MWPFSKDDSEPPYRRDIPLSLEIPAMEAKAVAGNSSLFFPLGSGSFMARTSQQYAKEGYAENGIVYGCIHKIAAAASSVGLQLQKGEDGDLVAVHPILDLLRRPNPTQRGSDLFYAITAWRLIGGEAFLVRSPWGTGKPATGKPTSLWLLEPHKVKVNHGMFGMPTSYEYAKDGGEKIIFPVDPIKGTCDVLHLRSFNPLNNTRGLSPMSPAAYAIDTHNGATRWNKALLDNAGRPSGALSVEGPNGQPMTLNEEQRAALQAQVATSYTGAGNSGRPLVLEAGMKWQEMGLTPVEMDYSNGVWTAATHICAAFGVPPQMLGIPGTSTFANFEQATLTFWEDVVVPLLESTLDGLNHWLIPMYGDTSLYLEADKDTISALEPRRQVKYDRAKGADFLKYDEKREMAGYDHIGPEAGGDTVLVSSTLVPLDLLAADVQLNPPPTAQEEDTTLPDQPAPKPKPTETVSGGTKP